MDRKLRLFLRRSSPLLAVMLFLAFINVMTTAFPWALFPIAAMGIPVFNIFIQTFLDDDAKVDGAAGDGEDVREELRRARHEARQQVRDQIRQVREEALSGRYAPPAESAAPAPSTAAPVPEVSNSGTLAAQLAQVRTYRQAVDNLAKNAPAGPRKDRLTDLGRQFAEWQKSVEQMAERINGFRQDAVIQGDLRMVPESIRKLEGQLTSEKDERVKAQIAKTLETRRNQLASLDKLQAYMRQAEIQLESAVASLGTLYTQSLSNQSTNAIADYAGLSLDVTEHVRVLQDQLEAIEEVRLGDAKSNLSSNRT